MMLLLAWICLSSLTILYQIQIYLNDMLSNTFISIYVPMIVVNSPPHVTKFEFN